MQNFTLYLDAKFSDNEKKESYSTAKRMLKIYNTVRSKGISSLKDETAEDNEFIKIGVNLMLEGLTGDELEKILQNIIWSGGYTGSELLKRLIIMQTLIEIINIYPYFHYHNTAIISNIVGALLGEEYILEIAETNQIEL